ncbi:MAG: ABC transporter permease, partial [Armatimonadetes bacterium]|nr:ABC transporter permease [Armatimonadota bacterium]
CMVGIFSGVYGGYMVSVRMSGIASGTFMDSLRQFVEPADFQGGMIKTVVFGLVIGLVACQQGLRTKRGAVGVGEATTRTVVLTMVLIYVVNYFMTVWLFG